jgi:hypothetical protein
MRRFFKNMQEFLPSFFEEEKGAITEMQSVWPFSELD